MLEGSQDRGRGRITSCRITILISSFTVSRFRPHFAAIDDGFKKFGFRWLIERVLYNDTVTRKKSSQANTLEPTTTLSYRNIKQKLATALKDIYCRIHKNFQYMINSILFPHPNSQGRGSG